MKTVQTVRETLTTTVVTDFNETLVRERTLPAWCADRLRAGPMIARLTTLVRMIALGPLAIGLDAIGAQVLAARIGFRVFRGLTTGELASWARHGLSANPRATAALTRLSHAHAPLRLVIVSRGTPAAMIAAYLDSPRGRAQLVDLDLIEPPRIMAPELAEHAGRLTGRVRAGLDAKRERGRLLEPPGYYLGDRRDRWARELGSHRFIEL